MHIIFGKTSESLQETHNRRPKARRLKAIRHKAIRHKTRRPNISKRKVKEIAPSPFYDGKYHPPIISSTKATLPNKLI
jgi:hypothetical protein